MLGNTCIPSEIMRTRGGVGDTSIAQLGVTTEGVLRGVEG